LIRLGSLAGYPFEGPRSLAGWTPASIPAVYAIMCRTNPDKKPQEFSVIYVGHSSDLTKEGFPFRHPKVSSWIHRAGDKWNLHICYYEIPGGLPSHREQISRELMAIYQPSCNSEKYDQTWKDEWIGEYSETMTDPLSTSRDPNESK
jgi:hypothetical protein